MNGNEREEVKMEECKETAVYMWGYLPGALPDKSPMLSTVRVRLSASIHGGASSWKDVCGGGCGFAMAISDCGKLITWGSTDDEGQSYLTSGKHGETAEPFPLPTEASIVKAAAGWAHCVSVTDTGEVYTWGWKECVPLVKVTHDLITGGSFQKDIVGKQSTFQKNRKAGEEMAKRRTISVAKGEHESLTSGDEFFTLSPCVVTLGPGVRITSVAAGGCHTLALSGKINYNLSLQPGQLHFQVKKSPIVITPYSFVGCMKYEDMEDILSKARHLTHHVFTGVSDVGQVWGWGYGGEGQLGLGSQIKMVSSPHLIPCIEQTTSGKDRSLAVQQGSMNSQTQLSKAARSNVKEIACGGRHSAIITDAGALLTFGWGLYGQCGQGSTTDLLRPTCISSLSCIQVAGVAAGLWHTVCIDVDGQVYTFGGNQFGQLGTGAEQVETSPKRLDAASLEGKHAKMVSCGARHSTMLTDDGQVLSWGWNKYGQLGLGDTIDRNISAQVPIDGCQPKHIACGWWHALLLAETPI